MSSEKLLNVCLSAKTNDVMFTGKQQSATIKQFLTNTVILLPHSHQIRYDM